jgi:hypothetical protein
MESREYDIYLAMITGFLINLVYLLMHNTIGLLPNGQIPFLTQFQDAIDLITGYVKAWSWLLPVDQLLAAVVAIIGIWFTVMLVKIALWVIRTVRGSA